MPRIPPDRMKILYDRAKPSGIARGRGTQEHRDLYEALRPSPKSLPVAPEQDHPLYEDFIRLTESNKQPSPWASKSEYNAWRRKNTESGQASYERDKARQVQKYHEGPYGSGARTRADQRARQRGEVEQLGKSPNWDYADQRIREVMDFYGIDDREVARQLARMHPEGELPNRARLAAAKKSTKPKVRKPEEVWYDVHKHPEGVPGGMGRSPEHHLRNRGWNGHEINEGSGRKTIQYRNPKHPDFVISYGGGNSAKPDHNFRVLYMGTNSNIPKVHRVYSVAEAMNKVEQLHDLQSGLVVQPMTHDAAYPGAPATKPTLARQPNVTQQHTFVAPAPPDPPRDMTDDDEHPIGPPKPDFPTKPEREHDWPKKQKPQLQEIPAPPPVKPPKYSSGPPRIQNDHGTLAGKNRHRSAGEDPCPLCRKSVQIYRKDPGLYQDLIKHSGGLTEDHLRTTSPFHDRIQEALIPRVGSPPRHPEGLGPADLGRAEYNRRRNVERGRRLVQDTVQTAGWHGMDLDHEDVARYPRLKRVISALQRANQETWEEA